MKMIIRTFCLLVFIFASHSVAAVPTMCVNQHYQFDQRGGACMPAKYTGFVDAAACNALYYCVLKSAYTQYIFSLNNGYKLRKNQPISYPSTSFYFVPDDNATFNTFDVAPNDSASPISCAKKACKTNTLVWVTQLHQLKDKICHNPTLQGLYKEKSKNFTNALGLFIRQLVGMPPLQATGSVARPYDAMGLYILSFPKAAKISLNPNNAKQLPITYQSISGMPTLLAKEQNYHINSQESSVLRLCRSTTQLSHSFCTNLARGDKTYNTWTKAWVNLVYPSNFLSAPGRFDGRCLLSGKVVDCTLTNTFFPWTSVGSTYNWSYYSGAKPQQSLHQGLYEYGIPQNVNFPKKVLRFVKIDKVFSELCS